MPSASKVAVVDLKNLKVTKTIDVPSAPQEVLMRPDGKVAYVSCNTTGRVAAIDLVGWKVAGHHPRGPGRGRPRLGEIKRLSCFNGDKGRTSSRPKRSAVERPLYFVSVYPRITPE